MIECTFESSSIVTLSFQALKQERAFTTDFNHYQLAPPCHVRDAAGVPVADALVEGEGKLEHEFQRVAARALRSDAALEHGFRAR